MSEDRLQSEIVKYIRYKYPKALFCASLGGIFTTPAGARKAIRTGYRKGQPDLFIYEPKGIYHGLAIEIKTIKGRATKEQEQWITDLQNRGWRAEICKGLPAILDLIDTYMNLKKLID